MPQKDSMRRHFCITLWLDAEGAPLFSEAADSGVIDLDPMLNELNMVVRGLRGRYYCWSLEDSRLEAPAGGSSKSSVGEPEAGASESGGLHVHVYLECERTVRWSTVRNRFQRVWKGANVQFKRGYRDTAREYHMGLKRGEEKPSHITHGEWGEWLDEHLGVETPHDFAEEAALMIMSGESPRDVALRFPRWFLSRGFGVIRLWETIHGENYMNSTREGRAK